MGDMKMALGRRRLMSVEAGWEAFTVRRDWGGYIMTFSPFGEVWKQE